MPDLKSNYDRLLLAAAGLIVSGLAFFLATGAFDARDAAVLPADETKQEPFASDPAVDALKADRKALSDRRPWEASAASPFVSRVYLLKDGRLVDILESGNDLFPGIPNAWIMEHALDYLDSGLPDADPDADGFTNLEEFSAKTNPRDTSSKPAEWTKLRLGEANIEKLEFKFMSLPKNTLDTVSINTESAEGKSTQFYPRQNDIVKTATGEIKVDPRTILIAGKGPDGQTIYEVTPFTFERAEFRKVFNEATSREEQVPVAIIRSTADNRTLELKPGQLEDSPYARATIWDTRPGGQTVVARVGSVFDMGHEENYKLVDVSEENATIEDLGSGERHVIPKAAMPAPQATPEEVPTP